jgi:hypothetical protein
MPILHDPDSLGPPSTTLGGSPSNSSFESRRLWAWPLPHRMRSRLSVRGPEGRVARGAAYRFRVRDRHRRPAILQATSTTAYVIAKLLKNQLERVRRHDLSLRQHVLCGQSLRPPVRPLKPRNSAVFRGRLCTLARAEGSNLSLMPGLLCGCPVPVRIALQIKRVANNRATRGSNSLLAGRDALTNRSQSPDLCSIVWPSRRLS